MSFWTGYHLNDFLFEGFNTTSIEGFAGIFLGLLSLSVFYEGLQALRNFVRSRFYREFTLANEKPPEGERGAPSTSSRRGEEGGHLTSEPDQNEESQPRPTTSSSAAQQWEEPRFIQPSSSLSKNKTFFDLLTASFLHMGYVLLSYILMLAVMTFNVWVFLAVIIGSGVGYAIFTYSRHIDAILENERVLIAAIQGTPPTEDPDRKFLLKDPERINHSDSSNESSIHQSEELRRGSRGEIIVGAEIHNNHEEENETENEAFIKKSTSPN